MHIAAATLYDFVQCPTRVALDALEDPDKRERDHTMTTKGKRVTSAEPDTAKRKQSVAKRIAREHYPYQCCVVCGLKIQTCLTVAHLDHDGANNKADNLAFLCWTHHWMYDCGFYPLQAIRLMRSHWQKTKGEPTHKARMKDAGAKAARTRKKKQAAIARKRSAGAKKAWTTRKQAAIARKRSASAKKAWTTRKAKSVKK